MGLSTVAEFLLPNSIDMEITDTKRKLTPLLWAIDRVHYEIAELLLHNGADPVVQGGRHGSVLAWAAQYGPQALVKLLLDKGADTNAEIVTYDCVLGAAASSYRDNEEIVELLLDHGAEIDA